MSQFIKELKMDGKRAKHHLNKLEEEEELIRSYQEGRRKYYSLDKEIKLEISPPPQGKFMLLSEKN
ncbi:MAG: Transcriptional regulator containing HTH domain, ArsR family [Candidatus Methanohalarchaeum thermophilum]|uniref:Transcriptional regulator containing HTH domain, ArsR family n=1 Tax=Methanohalarchaeum thermophilum TaxID=1903181 RepID=A0A1Q6DU99_METT1|nr:MAG: Transcriptional regulator containing HTH domain, ArsR family [Candidatus Methanohalarchaeum thermophilum]